MKRPAGIALWCLLAIWITALSIVNPTMIVPWWLLNLSGMMLVCWFAWHNTVSSRNRKTRHGDWKVNVEANHLIASVFVLLGHWTYKLCSAIVGKARSRSPKVSQTVEDKRVATNTLDMLSIHPKLTRKPLHVVIGYDSRKRPIVMNIGEDHTLIGASTKGGKTTLIRSILLQLLCKAESSRPDVCIIDLKANDEDGLGKFATVFEYIDEAPDAINKLRALTIRIRDRNKNKAKRKKPLVLVIDEISSLTDSNAEKDVMREGRRYMSRLAEKARSANVFLIVATQHPRYDTVPKSIINNLMRKIAFRVASSSQLEVILEHKPKVALPKNPGDFLMWDGRLTRGRTVLTRLSEIDTVLMAQAQHEKEPIHLFYRYLAAGRKVGDHVPGQGRAYEDNRDEAWCTQPFVREAFKNMVGSGILSAPKKGSSSTLLVEFLDGVKILKEVAT